MPTRSPAKSGVPVGNVPAVTGTGCLRASEPAIARTTHDRQEAAREHRQAERRVVPVGVPGQAAESRAVVVRSRRERVDDLGEAVRPGVQDRGLGVVEERRTTRREGEDQRRDDQEVEDDELHLRRLDLLAEVLGRSPDHEPGDEDREQREDQHPVEAGADASGAHLAEHDVHERDGAAERREAVVRGVDRAGRRPCRRRREEPGGGRAEADLLALVVARVRRPERLDARIAADLEAHGDARGGDPEHEHRREDRPALALVADEPAERVRQPEGDGEDRQHLDEVREAVRVLERMRRVRVVGAAAVGAELLDRLLARDRPAGDRLRRTLDRRRLREAARGSGRRPG